MQIKNLEVTFNFTIVDKKGESNSILFKVAVGGKIKSFSQTLLGNQENQTEGSFYNALNNLRLSQLEAFASQNTVDFLYYHGSTNGASIAAPSNSDAALVFDNSATGLQKWTVKNATKFKLLEISKVDFGKIDNDVKINSATSGATASSAIQLSIGKCYGFTTFPGAGRATKNGVFYVTGIIGSSTTSGSITFDVKIQE